MNIIISKDSVHWGLWHVTGDIRGFVQKRNDGMHTAVIADPYWGAQANTLDTLDNARLWFGSYLQALKSAH